MSEKKYILCPGWVTSKVDGDQHFINEAQLIRLYGVSPRECVSARSPSRLSEMDTEVMIELRPRYDGDYRLDRRTRPESGEVEHG